MDEIPCLDAPLVLVHGLFGFSEVKLTEWLKFEYFIGIRTALEEAGNRVFVAGVHPTGGIVQRAMELKGFIGSRIPEGPCHILAHSMGGLDSRHMITHLDMASRVLSLTTLGTPHRGSSFADWSVSNLIPFVGSTMDRLSIPRQAFHDLTRDHCVRFNMQTPDVPGVRYFSVAARYSGNVFNPTWMISHPIVSKEEGANDGIVSLRSAAWGESCEVWEGDHTSLVNWPQPGLSSTSQDRIPHYASLLRKLKKAGF